MPKEDVYNISLERVHRISSQRNADTTVTPKRPGPIIAKVSFHKDKELIFSSTKNIPKESASDSPRKIAEIRKIMYPILKDAKSKKRRQQTADHWLSL